MTCIVKYLGLMIGDHVPFTDKRWRLYKHLRQLTDLLTKPLLRRFETFHMDELVEMRNELYLKFFGKLKPKMHFRTHYFRVIKLYGTPMHYFANMLERKKRSLENIALSTICSLNLLTTIAMRHQTFLQ